MKTAFLILAIALACCGSAAAQKGTAEPDYYPMNYGGDTWAGEVTGADESTREVTLTYTSGSKTETFNGVLPADYKAKMRDGVERTFPVTDLLGLTVKTYYMKKEKKVSGQKIKYNEIFRIKFLPPKKKS